MRRPGPPASASSGPPIPGVPSTRGRGCWDSNVGVLFGGFCLGALRVPPPGTLPTGSLVAVSFFAHTLALCTQHSTLFRSQPRATGLPLFLHADPVAAAKFRPSACLSALRGHGDMCQVSTWGQGRSGPSIATCCSFGFYFVMGGKVQSNEISLWLPGNLFI
ncbi:hypothetical protein ACRRTK_015684 [Alexandromys fortis]